MKDYELILEIAAKSLKAEGKLLRLVLDIKSKVLSGQTDVDELVKFINEGLDDYTKSDGEAKAKPE